MGIYVNMLLMEACRKVYCLKPVVKDRIKANQADWQIKMFQLGLTNIISCGSTTSTLVFDRDTATMEDITQRVQEERENYHRLVVSRSPLTPQMRKYGGGRRLYPLHRIISEKDLHSILSLKEELRQRATISR